jgi:hypothetical protein
VRTVHEASSGYISNMKARASGGGLENPVLSVTQNFSQNHHIYKDNFYNSVKLAKTSSHKKIKSVWHYDVKKRNSTPPRKGNHRLEKRVVIAVTALEER